MPMEHAASAALSTPVHASVLWLIPFLPLFGALLNGAYGLFCKATGRKAPDPKLVDAIALGSVGVAFLLAVGYFFSLMGQAPANRSIVQTVWTWIDLGGARVLDGVTRNTVAWAYKFDPLSGAMTLLVTGVGFLIHLFSTGYMSEERKDGRYYRFMAYLNLFVFSMLNLVLGSNILMMFLGWEAAVIACSMVVVIPSAG